MAVLHRALFTWFILLVFFILLVLRLDGRTQWNWFIVFIPLWIYDSIMLFYILFNMISHCKNGLGRLLHSLHRKVWYVAAILLKITAQIILCLKLDYPFLLIPSYYVMIPLWILLPILIVDIFITLINTRS